MTQSHLWLCHWEHIDGPSVSGRATTSMVWICEHPYRTIRSDGPNEDCEGCPVWETMRRSQARGRRKEPQPALVGRGRSRGGGGHAA